MTHGRLLLRSLRGVRVFCVLILTIVKPISTSSVLLRRENAAVFLSAEENFFRFLSGVGSAGVENFPDFFWFRRPFRSTFSRRAENLLRRVGDKSFDHAVAEPALGVDFPKLCDSLLVSEKLI